MRLRPARTQDAPYPRHAPASLDQVRAADSECWRCMAKPCQSGTRPASVGDPLPLDECAEGVLTSAEFVMELLPLPAIAVRTERKRQAEDDDDSPKKKTRSSKRAGACPHCNMLISQIF